MKKTIVRVLTILCVLVLFSAMAMSAFAAKNEETLRLEVVDVTADGEDMLVTLAIDNRTGYNISFGWVNDCEIIAVTDEGTFYANPPSERIRRGESELVLELSDCHGELEKLQITQLCQLGDDGLPDRKMKDVTVYDENKGVEEFEGVFPFVSSTFAPVIIIAAIGITLVVTALIVTLVIWIRTRRRNEKALQRFDPYGAAPIVADGMQAAPAAPTQSAVQPQAAGNFCLHCGAALQKDSVFCSACGKKQVTRYQQTFYRGNMKEDELIDQINNWFAQYPQVANVKGKFMLQHKPGLLANKYVLEAFAIDYEVLNGQNKNRYGVVRLAKLGLARTDTDELLALWKQQNPNTTVINSQGGINQRGTEGSLALGGLGATNNTQLYVFFKFDRASGTAFPQ